MLLDWAAREGWIILTWWALATLAGLGALPLVMRLLGNLPDRGYTLARAAGVLLTSFVFWLLTSLGFLRNTAGSIGVAWLIVLGAGLLVYFQVGKANRQRINLRAWWRDNRTAVVVAEVLFLILLVSWSLVRAHQNNLVTTEKPMDLALLAAIQRTETFPPPDPWLSGYSISYYYFGYVIGAAFAQVSGVTSAMAYNLWSAMLFALSGLTAFGVVWNLVRSRRRDAPADGARRRPRAVTGVLAGLLGVYLLVIMGNYLTPLVDVPYYSGSASQAYLDFWDVRERQSPRPAELAAESPRTWGYWWWFRSARVIHDRNLPGMAAASEETINEFPMFSFVLADNHPHVMALPFTVLALGLALNVILAPRRPTWEQFILYGVIVGGLVFLNTWDMPTFAAVLIGAEALRRQRAHGRISGSDWAFLLFFGLALIAITAAAYFPFLISFRSQLGGALPNLIHPTHFGQYFLVFGALLPLAALFIGVEVWRARRDGRLNLSLGVQVALSFFILLAVILGLFIFVGMLSPEARNAALNYLNQAGGLQQALPEILLKRLMYSVTTIVLLVGLALIAARLLPKKGQPTAYAPATGLALLMIAGALAVTLIPDYVYLRDNFATRMNSVFKFYYQAWTLLAVAGAYGVFSLLSDPVERALRTLARAAAGGLVAVTLALGAVFPLTAIPERALYETGIADRANASLTLDGGRTLTNADDYATLVCLREIIGREPVVVAEVSHAGSYDYFAGGIGSGRLAGITGAPTVIGWQGHQSQWRGSGYSAAAGTRPDDIRRLYSDLRIDAVQDVVSRYGIDYILFGQAERERYGAGGEEKFIEFYDVVCESGGSRVYRTRPVNLSGS